MKLDIEALAREVGIRFDPRWGTCFTGNKQLEVLVQAVIAAYKEYLRQKHDALKYTEDMGEAYTVGFFEGLEEAEAHQAASRAKSAERIEHLERVLVQAREAAKCDPRRYHNPATFDKLMAALDEALKDKS